MSLNVFDPWNLTFFVGWIAGIVIRNRFINYTKDTKKVQTQIDGQEKALLFMVVPTAILLPTAYLFTPLLDFADYHLPVPIRICGTLTMILYVWLFWRSHTDLGKNWSPSLEIRAGHQLVTSGVYRSVRHPMYSAIWLSALAQGVLLPNWLAGWAYTPAFAAMYFLRVPREETMMLETFGNDYLDYTRRTGKLIPPLPSRSRP